MDDLVEVCRHGTKSGHGNRCIFCEMADDEALAADLMFQRAPYPTILAEMVAQVRYRLGWTVELKDLQRDDDHGRGTAGGLTLIITTRTSNSYRWTQCDLCSSPVTNYQVHHYFVVPAATYDRRAWLRWLFDQFIKVEQHECAEYFRLVQEGDFVLKDGSRTNEFVRRPFAPIHAPGADPYSIVEYASDVERRTSFRGTVKE